MGTATIALRNPDRVRRVATARLVRIATLAARGDREDAHELAITAERELEAVNAGNLGTRLRARAH